MDPIETISISLALGAGALIGKEVVSLAVKDAYSSLKELIKDNKVSAPLANLERDPGSTDFRVELGEHLRMSEAARNLNILRESHRLIEAVVRDAPEAARVVGIKLSDISLANARLRNIISTGDGVVAERITLIGDLEIDGVRAGASTAGLEK